MRAPDKGQARARATSDGSGLYAGVKNSASAASKTLLAFAAALSAPLAMADQAILDLWPSGPPGRQSAPTVLEIVERGGAGELRDRYATGITNPTLTIFEADRPNGSALLIIPGGGYTRVVMDKEGFETARWFAERGTTSFVLLYRLPGESWSDGADVVLQDTQRAMRIIRSRTAAYELRTDRIGVMGFSAGGHAAAMLSTQSGKPVYAPVDAADRQSARPDFSVLMYPVISMQGRTAHAGSKQNLLGPGPDAAAIEAQSPHQNVSEATPPTFLLHATDDESVPLANSLLMFEALQRAEIQTEMHVFAAGGHGFGLRSTTGLPVAVWPDLVLAWMRGLFGDPSTDR